MRRFQLKLGRNLGFLPQTKTTDLSCAYTRFVTLNHPYIVILSVNEGSAKVRGTNEKTEILRCAQDDEKEETG
ncbi:MAG: hypothetical protein J7M12_02160 [Candidatus Hydrogenedentes bacterium]|nr:hypothetical protein [Candidatus Hydrogenedentota bacterium]